ACGRPPCDGGALGRRLEHASETGSQLEVCERFHKPRMGKNDSTTGRAVNYGRTRARRRRDSLLPEVEELFDLVQNEEDQRALLDHDVGLRGHAELDDADLMPVVLELELR